VLVCSWSINAEPWLSDNPRRRSGRFPHPALGQDFEPIEPPLGPSDQWHQRMVQTGNALIRSHRRSASSLASMMFQLRAQAVPSSLTLLSPQGRGGILGRQRDVADKSHSDSIAFTVSGHRRSKQTVAKLLMGWADCMCTDLCMCTHPVWPAPSLLSPGGDPLRGFFRSTAPACLNRGRGSSQCRSESCSTPKQNPTDPYHRSETDERQKLD
jgi:hypothetical protein